MNHPRPAPDNSRRRTTEYPLEVAAGHSPELAPDHPHKVILEHPPAERLSGDGVVVGVGFRPGTGAAVIVSVVREVVGDRRVRCLATVERRAGEEGLVGAAGALGVGIVAFSAERLAEVEVPNPLDRTATAIGTPSVAEAAALCAAADGKLLVPKRVLRGVTVALAR